MVNDGTASDLAGESFPEGVAGLPPEPVFEVLADRRRRYVLYALREEEPRSLSELGRVVAAWDHGVPPDELAEDRHRRTCMALHHTHLPRLADVDAVEYDVESDAVSLDRIEPLEGLLDVAEDIER